MAVTIRLQNLPLSASAPDIRKYFEGLSIPNGGVHIVGGEDGDCFVAFSTDEDARKAMKLDGGKLANTKITLCLSSKSEMEETIAVARGEKPPAFVQNEKRAARRPRSRSPTMPLPKGWNGKESGNGRPTNWDPSAFQSLVPNMLPHMSGMCAPVDNDAWHYKSQVAQVESQQQANGLGSTYPAEKYILESVPHSLSYARHEVRKGNMQQSKIADQQASAALAEESALSRSKFLDKSEISAGTPPGSMYQAGHRVTRWNADDGPQLRGVTSEKVPNHSDANYFVNSKGANLTVSSVTKSHQLSGSYSVDTSRHKSGVPRDREAASGDGTGAPRMLSGMVRSLASSRVARDTREHGQQFSAGGTLQPNAPPVAPARSGVPIGASNPSADPGQVAAVYRPAALLPTPSAVALCFNSELNANDAPNNGLQEAHAQRSTVDSELPDGSGCMQSLNSIKEPFVCVQGLLASTTKRIVRAFFCSHGVRPVDIKLLRGDRGERNSCGYVWLNGVDEAIKALNQISGLNLEGGPILIEPCSRADFEGTVEFHSRSLPLQPGCSRPTTGDSARPALCVAIMGLPGSAGYKNVKDLLAGFQYVAPSLYVEQDERQLCTGTAYVEVSNFEDYQTVLSLNGRSSVHGQIVRVSPIAKERMKAGVVEHKNRVNQRPLQSSRTVLIDAGLNTTPVENGFEMTLNPAESGDHYGAMDIIDEQVSQQVLDRPGVVLHLVGLPFDCDIDLLMEFLAPARVDPTFVRLLVYPDGQCSGEGFVKLFHPRDVDEALKHHLEPWNLTPITIRTVNEMTMADIVQLFDARMSKAGGRKFSRVNAPLSSREQFGHTARGVPISGAGGCAPSALLTQVRFNNIPHSAMEKDMEVFFKDYGLVPGSARLQIEEGRPTLRGIITLKSQEDAEAAVAALDGKDCLGRPAKLVLIS